MSLLALQRDFRRHLTDAPVAMSAWLGGAADPGLPVYRNAYRVKLSDCLAETFALTYAWLGDGAFRSAARSYIEASSPTNWTLGVYGDHFADTLATLCPYDRGVPELARLEWQLSRAFEAADAPALAADELAAIDWDRAVIRFVPSLRLVPVTTNVGAIWSALTAGELVRDATLLPGPAHLLIWRQDFTPCFRTVDQAEVSAIMRLSTDGRFADFCGSLVAVYGEQDGPQRAGKMLGQWFADGLICEIITEEVSCD